MQLEKEIMTTTGKVNMSIVKVESASTSIQSLTQSYGAPCIATSNTSLHQKSTSASAICCSGDEENVDQCHLLLIDQDEKMPLLGSQCVESVCSHTPGTTDSPAGDKFTRTYHLPFAQSEDEKQVDLSPCLNLKNPHRVSCFVITLTLAVTIAMSLTAYILAIWLILYVWIEII